MVLLIHQTHLCSLVFSLDVVRPVGSLTHSFFFYTFLSSSPSYTSLCSSASSLSFSSFILSCFLFPCPNLRHPLHFHLLFSHHTFQPLILSQIFFAPRPSAPSPPLYHIFFTVPPSSFSSRLSTSSSRCSAPPQRAPGASPSAHNISSAAVSDRPNFSRGVGIRSTFHAGQQRGARDQQGSAYPGGPASPSLSHGNSQARRTHGATGIFSKFTSKFVRR